jgi:hypothetical protein
VFGAFATGCRFTAFYSYDQASLEEFLDDETLANMPDEPEGFDLANRLDIHRTRRDEPARTPCA